MGILDSNLQTITNNLQIFNLMNVLMFKLEMLMKKNMTMYFFNQRAHPLNFEWPRVPPMFKINIYILL